MNVDLFGNLNNNEPEAIRTLGLYQPFASLMLHGKIETRWVLEGRKPPFPIGKYLFYSTKKGCSNEQIFDWCGKDMYDHILKVLKNDDTSLLNGYAIAIGDLVRVRKLECHEENIAFVKFVGKKTVFNTNDGSFSDPRVKVQWALVFDNVKPIQPFEWNFGAQGIGKVPDSEMGKIKFL